LHEQEAWSQYFPITAFPEHLLPQPPGGGEQVGEGDPEGDTLGAVGLASPLGDGVSDEPGEALALSNEREPE